MIDVNVRQQLGLDILPNGHGVRLCLIERRSTNHRLSNPLVLDRRHSGQRARCLPLEGINPGDFEEDNSNIERDDRVALHHRLGPQGPIYSLPLSHCGLEPF